MGKKERERRRLNIWVLDVIILLQSVIRRKNGM